MRYQHHWYNYEKSLETGITLKVLKIKKASAFHPVSDDFYIKWEEVLYNAEKNLVQLLLYESWKVIAKIELDLTNEIQKLHPTDYNTKRSELANKNENYKKAVRKKKFKEVAEFEKAE